MTAMRIVYFSDVHIEIRESQRAAPWSDTLPLGFGPELSTFVGAADLLILAGDIGRVHSTRNVSPLSYAREAADFLGCGVVLVPGNHEYYRGCFREVRAALLAAGDRTVTVLDRGEAWIARGGAAADSRGDAVDGLRGPRTRAGGQGHRCARPLGRGPHRGRRFIARATAPGIGIMKIPARVPL